MSLSTTAGTYASTLSHSIWISTTVHVKYLNADVFSWRLGSKAGIKTRTALQDQTTKNTGMDLSLSISVVFFVSVPEPSFSIARVVGRRQKRSRSIFRYAVWGSQTRYAELDRCVVVDEDEVNLFV